MKINIPLQLTLARLIISPTILPLLLVYLLPYNYLWLNVILALIYGAFSLTDFLDGYLARKYNQQSAIGALLDPIADKFLLYSTLIALVVVQKIFFVWVIILIGRELFLMGLRQIALEYGFSIKVSSMGKIKTVFLSIALGLIIVDPLYTSGFFYYLSMVKNFVLAIALVLSITSAYHYYRLFIAQFKRKTLQ